MSQTLFPLRPVHHPASLFLLGLLLGLVLALPGWLAAAGGSSALSALSEPASPAMLASR